MRWHEIIAENGGLVVPGVNTTPDVKQGEIARQAAKWGWKLSPDGVPPIMTRYPERTDAKDTTNKDTTGKQTFYGKNGTPPQKKSPVVENYNLAQWPAVLKNYREIASYISDLASDYVDEEMLEDYFRGCSAKLELVPVDSLREGPAEVNIPSKAKQKRYAKLDAANMPPIVVMDGQIVDGHHRYRDAKAKGLTEIPAYVVS